MLGHILAGLAAMTAWALFVGISPKGRCHRCNGWGSRKRNRACGRCKGTGIRFRPGARLVHSGVALGFEYVRDLLDQRREG